MPVSLPRIWTIRCVDRCGGPGSLSRNKVNVYVGFDLYLDSKVEADIVQTLYTGYDGAQCEVLFKCMELADRRQEEIRAIAPDEDQAHEDMSLEP